MNVKQAMCKQWCSVYLYTGWWLYNDICDEKVSVFEENSLNGDK